MEETENKVTALDFFNQNKKIQAAKKRLRSEEQKLNQMVKEAGGYLHQKLVVKGTLYDVTACYNHYVPKVAIEELGSVENLQKLFESQT